MKPSTVICEGCLAEKRPDFVCFYNGTTLCVACFVKAATPTQPEPEPVPAPEAPTPEDDRYCEACGAKFEGAARRFETTGRRLCRSCFLEEVNVHVPTDSEGGVCDVCDGEISGPGWLCETNRCCEACARTWAEEIAPVELNDLRGEAAEAASLKAAANEAADRRKCYESSARTDLRQALDSAADLARSAAADFITLTHWLAEAQAEAANPETCLEALSNVAHNLTSRLDWVSQYGRQAAELTAQFRAVSATLQTLRNLTQKA